jgi:ribosome-binding protein aMBF1 (putative translation factor)
MREEITRENAGQMVKEVREERGLSVRELAGKLRVNSKSVDNWERGRAEPADENLRKIKEWVGVEDENEQLSECVQAVNTAHREGSITSEERQKLLDAVIDFYDG